jgi:hypothetical protein
VRELLGALGSAGLVEARAGVVSLTTGGATRYTELRNRIDVVTTRIFEQFDAARVETTRGLLQEIAEIDPEQLTLRSVRAG